jgi:TfoX/Sxy family transcriptional regulator of competence genes
MACDEGLVERIRTELAGTHGSGEKRMFGGVCFTLNGNMLCGVVKDQLMCRIGEEAYEVALNRKHVKPMDFTGKPMKGYIFVTSEGLAEDEDLRDWIGQCKTFVAALPIKAAKKVAAKRKLTLPAKAKSSR